MKRLLIGFALLASFGASAQEYVYNCTGADGVTKGSFTNGTNVNGEYINFTDMQFMHTGTTEEDSSKFESGAYRLYVKWAGDKTIITVFQPVYPIETVYICETPN